MFLFSVISRTDRNMFAFPLQHVDHYSRTKSIAEQMVLAANGTPLAGTFALT